MKRSTSIKIHVAITAHERAEAIHFIETQMRMIYGCEPPETTGMICVASTENEIVGSVVLGGITEETLFPVEKYYDLEGADVSFLHNRSDIVQASRWIATRPGVSSLVLEASFTLAHNLGKHYALLEAKPYSAKRINELGFKCQEIKGAKLQTEKVLGIVGDHGMRYFIEPPLPSLYLTELISTLTHL